MARKKKSGQTGESSGPREGSGTGRGGPGPVQQQGGPSATTQDVHPPPQQAANPPLQQVAYPALQQGIRPSQQGGRGWGPQSQQGGRVGYPGGRGGPQTQRGGMAPQHYGEPPAHYPDMDAHPKGPPEQRRGGSSGRGFVPSPAGPRPPFPELHQAIPAPYQAVVTPQSLPFGQPVVTADPASTSKKPEPVPVTQLEQMSLQPGGASSQIAPASSKAVRFPLRPGRGSTGMKCIVKANHFFAELPDKDLHQYDVCTKSLKCLLPHVTVPKHIIISCD